MASVANQDIEGGMPLPDIETRIPPYCTGPAYLVTARSYFIDRFVPDCEIIHLPAKEVAGGTLRFGQGPVITRTPEPKNILKRIKASRRRPTRRIEGSTLIDLRLRSPQNFAHFLNNHLPIVFHIAERLALDWSELLLLTPADTPGYIRAATDLFGLTTLATDDDVEGPGIRFEMTPWTATRPVRAGWVREPSVVKALNSAPEAPPLPRKVFLSRRKTRMISNEQEATGFLEPMGFETIYPEDLSVADQMRLFREAEVIVAIHGAALAPLLYVPPDGRLKQIIEILPCGHVTDVYRVMAEQVGCAWIGVRGRIKPDYVPPAYDLGSDFKTFSLDAFEVDIAALERAFALTTEEGSRNG